MSRDPERTRANILGAAFDTVYHHGFRATSVNEIAAKAGVTQGAFFHYFPTKNDLGYTLAEQMKEVILDRWTRPLVAYKNPLQGIASKYRKNMEAMSDEEIALGCPLNNLTQEMSFEDPIFRDKLREVLRAWIEETEQYLRKAQAEGFVKPDVDVRKAAEFIVMVEEGSAAIVKNLLDRKVYWSLYESFKRYLESISAGRQVQIEA